MANPFREAGPVRGDAFCDRDVETDHALETIRSGRPVLVQGEDGAGTSSLLLRIRDRLRDAGWAAASLDLWRSDGPAALADELRAAVVELTELLGGGAGPEPTSEGPEAEVRAALAALAELADTTDRRVALVIDEVHRSAEIDGIDALTGLLELSEARRPGTASVGLVLGGGEFPVDSEAEGAPALPGDPFRIRLRSIPLEAWLPFVLERFLLTDRWIENRHVERIVQVTGGHPARTQAVLHALWDRVERNEGARDPDLERALEDAVRRRGPGYTLLWRTLTPNQRRVLRGLALEGPGARPFASGFVHRHHLASPSSAQRALQALEKLRLVSREGDEGPRLVDPFLRSWLRARSSAAVDSSGGADAATGEADG